MELREYQKVAVEQILDSFKRCSVVFLDAPTGSGKTFIANGVREIIGTQIFPIFRGIYPKCIYSCTTKNLQKQICDDFDSAKLIQGRRNYRTAHFKEKINEVWCDECTKTRARICVHCDPKPCPYDVEKEIALNSEITVVNYHYLLRIIQGQSDFRSAGIYIFDEADDLEEVLIDCSIVSIPIVSHLQSYKKTLSLKIRVNILESHIAWFEEKLSELKTRLEIIWHLLELNKDNIELTEKYSKEYSSLAKKRKSTQNTVKRVENLIWLLEKGYEFVYTVDENSMQFKPLQFHKALSPFLFQEDKKWLLMSSTFINLKYIAESLELEKREWEAVTVPSTFDICRRPIFIRPVGRMSRNSKHSTMPRMLKTISNILNTYKNVNILIHAVSKTLQQEIYDGLLAKGESRLMKLENDDKPNLVSTLQNTPKGRVVVSVGLERGVDLKGDLCRVIIIPKVPYLNLGDEYVKTKARKVEGWYNNRAISRMVQMTGRGMRDIDDECTTFILDQCFTFLKFSSFPKWWRTAIK